ncbi:MULTISPECIES: hypothetical protein [Haloferax]|uniref:Uncharacterized protein n=2 Tax=Haloferax gibbonsii TaxID=35746 RepID=A0A0K1ITG4_HALGI|nr:MULTISPECIES: hypothetical protein [Haloferax]AKU07620.1 hypothetical protein ABY42_07635 [Haloferax gibbonsii]ELZ77782.1 hypothetical protein C454_14860 [Haloferax gibbonsii ATCC 33959]QOS11733.1 uncharacterized protein HfgLR_07955 [Haloferax gibbonsii]RDZ55492.1 hypothetical protein C5C07_08265 [Haloferax sp. Atlit-4N]REA04858.1 hypothetical protein DEQ92_00825 [Haloferax sp. Atlit-6N]
MRDALRSSPLFSGRRLLVCFVVTLVVVTTDALFFHVQAVRTAAEFATEVTIHTLGFYGGYTIVALFNRSGT